MKRLIIPFVVLFLLFVSVPGAFAVDAEIYTYTGFRPVTTAFKTISLIFSDYGYYTFAATMAVIGVFFGGAAYNVKLLSGQPGTPFSWMIPVALGGILFVSMIVKTGTVTVYDEVLNRFENISGVPNAIVMIAGTSNTIEHLIVDKLDTAASPGTAIKEGIGGLGFQASSAALLEGLKNTYATQSMSKFVEDCVLFELVRPGPPAPGLTYEDLINNTTDYLTLFASAQNPAIFTTYYDGANPQGVTQSCTDAWTSLNSFYADGTNYTNSLKGACSKALFSPANASEMTRCKDLVVSTIQNVTGVAVTAEQVVRQGDISRILFEVVKDGAPEQAMAIMTNRGVASSGTAFFVAANEWIPGMRAAILALIVGFTPFLVLFFPTPVFKKMLLVTIGLFVWVTAWGVADAVIHNFGMEMAVNFYEEVRQSKLGLSAFLNFPDTTTKTLALFGKLRSAAGLFATVIVGALGLGGGSVMGMMSSNIAGSIQRHSAGEGAAMGKTEGRTQAMASQQRSAAINKAWDNGGKFDFNKAATSEANQIAARVGSGTSYGSTEEAYDIGAEGSAQAIGGTRGRTIANQQMGVDNRAGSEIVAQGNQTTQLARQEALNQEAQQGPFEDRADFERRAADLIAAGSAGNVLGKETAGGPDAERAGAANLAAEKTAFHAHMAEDSAQASAGGEIRGREREGGTQELIDQFGAQGSHTQPNEGVPHGSPEDLGGFLEKKRIDSALGQKQTIDREAEERGIDSGTLIRNAGQSEGASLVAQGLVQREQGTGNLVDANVANQTYQVAKGTAMGESAGRIGTFDGLDGKARTEQLDRAFKAAGFTDTFSGMLAKNGSVSMNLNDDQAQALFGGGAHGGAYSISRDADGGMQFHEGTRGGKENFFDLTTARVGRDTQALDINSSTSDQTQTQKSGLRREEGDHESYGDRYTEQNVRERTRPDGHSIEYQDLTFGRTRAGQMFSYLEEQTMTADGFTTSYKDQFGDTGYSISTSGNVRHVYDDQKNINIGVNVQGSQATHNIREVLGEEYSEAAALAGKNVSEAAGVINTVGTIHRGAQILKPRAITIK